jgi:hypothetical protein
VLHVTVTVRIGLFIAGLALTAAALDLWRVLPIREHISRHRNTYSRTITYLAFSISGLVVLAAYLFSISTGQWKVWPPTTDYYNQLARSFQAGRLYVQARPDPALLALPNPYDPEARKSIPGLEIQQPGTIWDMSLYNSRVYLYWGPAPALMLSAVKLIYPADVGDQVLTFAFLLGSFVFQVLLLVRIWRRFFRTLPAWTVIGGIILAGFINPALWLLNIPRIYEAAIAAGQFFLMAGLYIAFVALDRDVPSRWRLALAAIAWVCAVASRGTLAVPVAFLGLMVLLWILRKDDEHTLLGARIPYAAAFGVPLLAGAVLLAWYNFARFGSILEFGFRYSITMLDQNKYHNILFSPIYLLPNIYLYLFNPPSLDAVFPFVRPVWNEEFISAFNNRFHTIYNAERIVGLLYVAPFLLFALAPPLLLIIKSLRVRTASTNGVVPLVPPAPEPFFRWLVITLVGSAILELLIVFFVYYATMRYFLDVTPTLLMISMMGFWLGYHRLENKPFWKASYGLLAIALIVFTVIMGILVGFSADVPRIRASNPALLAHLRLFFISLARRIHN